jgi:hypothetical protein
MIMHLFREKYLSDILMALTEAGIEDTIVLGGEAIGHKLVFDVPLFASFRDSYGAQRDYGKVIMGVADKDQVDFIIEELKHAGIDLKEKDIAKIYLIPLEEVF